jgi:hypothetical protein
VIAERRLETMRELSQTTSTARTLKECYAATIKALAKNDKDLPWAMIYDCEIKEEKEGNGSTTSGSASGGAYLRKKNMAGSRSASKRGLITDGDEFSRNNPTFESAKLRLQGSIGIPKGHRSAPKELVIKFSPSDRSESTQSVDESGSSTASTEPVTVTGRSTPTLGSPKDNSNWPWPFQEAIAHRKPIFMGDLKGRDEGFEVRGWDEPARVAVVIPILIDETRVKSVLIVSLNPRRPW